MRIISNFKDYYDGLQDPTNDLLYIRFKQEIINSREIFDVINTPKGIALKSYDYLLSNSKNTYSYSLQRLIFCGKVYTSVCLKVDDHHNPTVEYIHGYTKYYWTTESFLKENRSSSKKIRNSFLYDKLIDVEEALSSSAQLDTKALELCHKYNVPIIGKHRDSIYEDYKTYSNAPLSQYQFHSAMDIYQTFQELSMFIGGVLTRKESLPVMTNKEKLVSHGMDDMSFKKFPTKHHE